MHPLLETRLRRTAPLIAALVVCLLFLLVHQVAFAPLAQRYNVALEKAGPMGAALDPAKAVPTIPPRVFALLSDNSLPASEVDRRAQSGQLAAELMQDLSRRASAHGLDVLVTEPGVNSPEGPGLVVRAHLRLRGRYGALLAYIDDLARAPRLTRLERFSVTPAESSYDIEMNVARLVLRRTGGPS